MEACDTIKYLSPSYITSKAPFWRKIAKSPSLACNGIYFIFSLEEFSIGGLDRVRGYRQDAILADNGLSAAAELRATLARFSSFDGSLQLIPFVDFGTVWNSSESLLTLNTNTIGSVGLALAFNISEDFTARIDWGQPLVGLTTAGNSLQENGVYFQLEYKRRF